MVWCRVTRHPRIFRGLTGCQRTLGILGVTEIEQQIPAEEVDRPQGQSAMEDFWKHVIREYYSVIMQPEIEANNFELKLALITMV